jgi:hypothetical protein
MAFDTIDERAAGICVGLPFGRVYMEPSAVAFDAADQQHLLWLFREPLASEEEYISYARRLRVAPRVVLRVRGIGG